MRWVKRRLFLPLAAVLSLLVLFAGATLLVGRTAAKAEALYDGGKLVVNDYETNNPGYTGEAGKTAVSTEPCNPFGTMISTDNAYATWDQNFQYQPFKTNWSGAKYMLFYAHNKATEDKAVQPLISMHKADGDRKHFYPTAGVMLDDGTAVSAAAYTDDKVVIPAGFQGYVKVDLAPENLAELWAADEAGVLNFAEVMQVNFFGGDAQLFVDTVTVSFDDDITEPITPESAAFDRVLMGNTFTAISDFWWMMRGDEWFDGAATANGRATYDNNGAYMTFNNAGNVNDCYMWQKETLLADWNKGSWDRVKYFVFEIQNNDAANATQVAFQIDAGVSYQLNWYGDYLLRGKDGAIVYRTTQPSSGTNGRFDIPAGFDGYVIADVRMFSDGDNFTETNIFANALTNVKRISPHFYAVDTNVTVGRVGYSKSDLIRYNNPAEPLEISDDSRYASASADNELVPVASFMTDADPAVMTENMSNGVTVTVNESKDGLHFAGTATESAAAFIPSIADLNKLQAGETSMLVLDVKNNLATDSKIKPLVKTYNRDSTNETEEANYSTAWGARVHLWADGGQPVMQITQDAVVIPANFRGKIFVPYSTLKEDDTNTGRAFNAAKIKSLGFMPIAGSAADFDVFTPYLAKSFRAVDTQATTVKLDRSVTVTASAESVAYGASVTLSASDESATFAITEGDAFATLTGNALTATKAGGTVHVTASLAETAFYNAAVSQAASITTVKAVPTLTVAYTESVLRGVNADTLTAVVTNASAQGRVVFESKVLSLGENTVAWTFTPTDAENYENATGSVKITAVMPALASIAITTAPTKTEYKKGESLDLTGLVVTATYADQTTETVAVTAENVTGYDTNTVGEQTLTVTVDGKTATFTVTVKEATAAVEPAKKGCGSSAAGASVALMLLTAAAAAIALKKGQKRKA